MRERGVRDGGRGEEERERGGREGRGVRKREGLREGEGEKAERGEGERESGREEGCERARESAVWVRLIGRCKQRRIDIGLAKEMDSETDKREEWRGQGGGGVNARDGRRKDSSHECKSGYVLHLREYAVCLEPKKKKRGKLRAAEKERRTRSRYLLRRGGRTPCPGPCLGPYPCPGPGPCPCLSPRVTLGVE